MWHRLLRLDWILLLSTGLLLSIGLLVLYSISSTGWQGGGFFFKQSIFSVFGFVSLGVMVAADYRHIARLATPLYFVMLLLLALVFVVGTTIRGTQGWIDFGIVKFQPVEIAKIVLIVFLASFIAKKRVQLGDFTRLAASMVLSGLLIGLVLLQPDLGSGLVLIGIWTGMIFLSGLRFSHIILLVLLGISVVGTSWFFLAPYQKDRILNVFEPKADPRGSGYNVLQAVVSVGSGGLTGEGIGHGSQSRLNFLPEKHTDFIFSTIAEELGLLGAYLVLFLYGIIFFRIWRIGMQARDNFGYLVCAGVFMLLLVQVTVNVGMNIGLLPVTGIPLPLISYGGSSLVAMLMAVALVLNIGLKSQEVTLEGL